MNIIGCINILTHVLLQDTLLNEMTRPAQISRLVIDFESTVAFYWTILVFQERKKNFGEVYTLYIYQTVKPKQGKGHNII